MDKKLINLVLSHLDDVLEEMVEDLYRMSYRDAFLCFTHRLKKEIKEELKDKYYVLQDIAFTRITPKNEENKNLKQENFLNLSLTDAQLFELEKIKRDIPNMSRIKLQNLILDAVKMSYGYQNALKSILEKQV